MKRTNENEYTLSTGRTFYANCGIIGLSPEGDITEGYDGFVDRHPQAFPAADPAFTPEEKAEIADFMIQQWEAYRNELDAPKPAIPEKMDTMILLQLYQSMTLCDHMGDAWDDVYKALELAGVDLEDDGDEYSYRAALTKMGVTTLWGSSLGDDDE